MARLNLKLDIDGLDAHALRRALEAAGFSPSVPYAELNLYTTSVGQALTVLTGLAEGAHAGQVQSLAAAVGREVDLALRGLTADCPQCSEPGLPEEVEDGVPMACARCGARCVADAGWWSVAPPEGAE